MKGCYIYCNDEETENYLRSIVGNLNINY
ncbi:hypothetical protein [Fodinibius salsisoli]